MAREDINHVKTLQKEYEKLNKIKARGVALKMKEKDLNVDVVRATKDLLRDSERSSRRTYSNTEKTRKSSVKLKGELGGIKGQFLGIVDTFRQFNPQLFDDLTSTAQKFGGQIGVLEGNLDSLTGFASTMYVETQDAFTENIAGLDKSMAHFYESREDLQHDMRSLMESDTYYTRMYMENRETINKKSIKQALGMSAAMGMSFRDVQNLLENEAKLSVGRTEKLSTDFLARMGYYAKRAEKLTGLNFKAISRHMTNAKLDVKNFANASEEDLSKLSVVLEKTGLSVNKFTSMISSFQAFDTAASKVGNLTAAFGINLDTMNLMMAAQEGSASFITELREGFDAAGLSIEDMNMAQKRLLASQLNVDVRDLGGLFEADDVEEYLEKLEEGEGSASAKASEMTAALDDVKKHLTGLSGAGKALDRSYGEMWAGIGKSIVAPAAAFDKVLTEKVINVTNAAVNEIGKLDNSVLKLFETALDNPEKLNSVKKILEDLGSLARQGAFGTKKSRTEALRELSSDIDRVLGDETTKSFKKTFKDAAKEFTSAIIGEDLGKQVRDSLKGTLLPGSPAKVWVDVASAMSDAIVAKLAEAFKGISDLFSDNMAEGIESVRKSIKKKIGSSLRVKVRQTTSVSAGTISAIDSLKEIADVHSKFLSKKIKTDTKGPMLVSLDSTSLKAIKTASDEIRKKLVVKSSIEETETKTDYDILAKKIAEALAGVSHKHYFMFDDTTIAKIVERESDMTFPDGKNIKRENTKEAPEDN